MTSFWAVDRLAKSQSLCSSRIPAVRANVAASLFLAEPVQAVVKVTIVELAHTRQTRAWNDASHPVMRMVATFNS
jgi:hypothetical protein